MSFLYDLLQAFLNNVLKISPKKYQLVTALLIFEKKKKTPSLYRAKSSLNQSDLD